MSQKSSMNAKKQSTNNIKNLLDGRELVFVSNRGPVTFERNDKKRVAKRGAGGLITAVDSALSFSRALWVAGALSPEDRVVAAEGRALPWPPKDPRYQMSLVDIEPQRFELYYNEISNKILWFLQHYLFDPVKQPTIGPAEHIAWKSGYRYVNKLFADSIAAVIEDEPEPVVMVQDYHLYLVSGLIRQIRPDARILHFTHIPWPAADYFRLIPAEWRREILESLLACDVVGFHSRRYGRNFMDCCRDFLGAKIDSRGQRVVFRNREVAVRAYPISIDSDELLAHKERQSVTAWQTKFEEERGDCQLIVRIDRAELSKNLVRGFAAFRLLLQEHPEYLGKVKFLAFAYPTRQEVPDYARYRAQIETVAKDINDEFGSADWSPIELEIEDDFDRSVAAMTTYDVMLTNPIFDGMNLVAKEAAILNERDGVIVLSENAGAYEELRDGVLGVNPFDIKETMDRLHQALVMTPLEREARAARVKEIVLRNDSHKWLTHQVADLLKPSAPSSDQQDGARTPSLR